MPRDATVPPPPDLPPGDPQSRHAAARTTARPGVRPATPAAARARTSAIGRRLARAPVVLCALALAGGAAAQDAAALRIGVAARIATAPLHIAASRGYFEREGIDVELVPAGDTDLIEALAEEELDLATLGASALLEADDGGLDLRGAYVLGLSGAADALVAREEVRDTRRLVGRRVAVLPGSSGELVLRRALQRKGRRLANVEPVALGGADAVRALRAGEVDAAALHGPALAALLRTDVASRASAAATDPAAGIATETDPEAVATPLRVLATGEAPRGLVSDLLVGTDEALAASKERAKEVVRALDRAVGWMRRHPDDSVALLAEVFAAEPADVARALDGTTLLDVEENMTLLRGEFQKSFSSMSEVLDDAVDERAREVPSANRYLSLSALRQVAAGR